MTALRGKILVIRGGAIGDFILTLPVLSALRARFPEAHLEVLGYPHIVQLALAGGLVDRVQSIEARALAGFFARNGELESDLVDYFSEFDIIISYLYDPDQIFCTNLSRCTPAQFIAGPHRAGDTAGVHAAEVYLKPLERLAIFDADKVPRLRLKQPPAVLNRLALHPGSGSERKNWPEARWAELLGCLRTESAVDVLLIGGEAEAGRLQRLAASFPTDRLQLAQSLPLPRLGDLLQECVAFVGHDSGISHLAAALGLPGLVLWGDTVESVWRPPSEKVEVVRGTTGLANLAVSEVLGRLETLLSSHK